MNHPTPSNPSPKSSMHPMMMIAAAAVVLFCGVGTAALMGWLPTSHANGADAGTVPESQLAADNNGRGVRSVAPDNERERAPVAQSIANRAPAVCNSCGVVDSVRQIQHRAQGSGVGAAGGAILGGLLGNQVGGGHGRQLATVAGAVGGAVAGNQIEGNMKSTSSWQIVVRMDNGNTRTFNQSAQPDWRAGDGVKVVDGQLRSMN